MFYSIFSVFKIVSKPTRELREFLNVCQVCVIISGSPNLPSCLNCYVKTQKVIPAWPKGRIKVFNVNFQTFDVNLSSPNINCSVSVVGKNEVSSSKSGFFAYRETLTSRITSVSPSRGGTGGGVQLTILGNGKWKRYTSRLFYTANTMISPKKDIST